MKTGTMYCVYLAIALSLALSAAPAVAAVVDGSPAFDVSTPEADAVETYTLTASEAPAVFVLVPAAEPLFATSPTSWRPATARAPAPSLPGEPLGRSERWRT
jgi:hypothetical protein